MNLTEKLLKDSFTRTNLMSMDITTVRVDTRQAGHDVLHVYVRGTPAGQLVIDKTDSITIARRLIPDSLRYDKEPSGVVRDVERMAAAFFALLIEARTAAGTRDVNSLAAFLRKMDANNPAVPFYCADFLPNREARVQAEGHEHPSEPPTVHPNQ